MLTNRPDPTSQIPCVDSGLHEPSATAPLVFPQLSICRRHAPSEGVEEGLGFCRVGCDVCMASTTL
jgi:hypothetical protein